MLREIRHVRQEPGRHRRWFHDDGFELVVWQASSGGIEGFQICYATQLEERALTWRREQGFSHARVDGGDTSPLKNQTPILLPDGAVPWAELMAQFRERSDALDAGLRELILQRLSARS